MRITHVVHNLFVAGIGIATLAIMAFPTSAWAVSYFACPKTGTANLQCISDTLHTAAISGSAQGEYDIANCAGGTFTGYDACAEYLKSVMAYAMCYQTDFPSEATCATPTDAAWNSSTNQAAEGYTCLTGLVLQDTCNAKLQSYLADLKSKQVPICCIVTKTALKNNIDCYDFTGDITNQHAVNITCNTVLGEKNWSSYAKGACSEQKSSCTLSHKSGAKKSGGKKTSSVESGVGSCWCAFSKQKSNTGCYDTSGTPHDCAKTSQTLQSDYGDSVQCTVNQGDDCEESQASGAGGGAGGTQAGPSGPFHIPSLIDPLGGASAQTVIGRVIKGAMSVVGSISLALFVYAGVMWLTAAGNEERVKSSTKIMLWAVIGLVTIFASYMLVQLIFSAVK